MQKYLAKMIIIFTLPLWDHDKSWQQYQKNKSY